MRYKCKLPALHKALRACSCWQKKELKKDAKRKARREMTQAIKQLLLALAERIRPCDHVWGYITTQKIKYKEIIYFSCYKCDEHGIMAKDL